MGRLALAVLLLTSAGLGEASACNFVNFRFFFGTDSNTDMTARSGSRPGYKGPDSFAFTVSGTTPFKTGSTTVEMRVTVE